jgi:hypothetical protein
MPLFRDDGTAEINVPIEGETWTAIHQPNLDPVNEVHRRGLDRLRLKHEYEEDEIAVVSSDQLYLQSCRSEYWAAKKMFDKKRKLPKRFRLEFQRPGTRKSNNGANPEEKQ